MSSQNSLFRQEEIPPNTLIHNRYLIQQILGQGGLGRTYLALDTHRFSELCVLKEFAPFGSGYYDFEKSRNLFKREAKILHQLSHPQIPEFLACFENRGRLFLVQEYVTGRTYSELLKERQQNKRVFTEQEIIRWLMNLLPILDYIHQIGIIHRDISPDNIMQPEGKNLPVLIDFGVGKLTNLKPEVSSQGSKKYSYVGKMSFVGKIGYAPREQISMGRCSPSSDIYALGVTAVVLLTGKEPTALVNQFSLEWEWQQYAQVSPQFQRIVSKMIEEKPSKRYQSAPAVLQDLQQFFVQNKSNHHQSKAIAEPYIPAAKSASPQSKGRSQSEETVIISSASTSPASPPDNAPNTSSPIVDDTFIVTAVNSSPPESSSLNKPISNNSAGHQKTPSVDDNTMIISSVNPAPSSSVNRRSHSASAKPRSQNNHSRGGIRPELIRRCEQQLSHYIGSMAGVVVQNVVQKQKPQSSAELINALAEYIPDLNQAQEFRRLF